MRVQILLQHPLFIVRDYGNRKPLSSLFNLHLDLQASNGCHVD